MTEKRIERKKSLLSIAGFLLIGCLALTGCSTSETFGTASDNLVDPDETYEKADHSSMKISDDASRYEGEDDPAVVTMYLTVGQGNEDDGTDHTWEEVNTYPMSYYEEKKINPYACEAVLQIGDEEGPVQDEFGYGELAANATVRLRGGTASEKEQKSYRITIKEGKGNWEDQKAVILNKYTADPLRLKSRLSYQLMEGIPGLISARTRFVHLYVKDRTEGENGLFVDYGLYTQVEKINKTYLRNHNLDKDGELYEAEESFDWGLHEDALMLATASDFSQEAFEQYLEIEGSDDHSGILELLQAVNDESAEITDVVEQYFDEENLYHWLAFQILTGNRDALDGGNYYLYSPQTTGTWYFISADSDDLLKDTYEALQDPNWESSWNHGMFSFVNNRLFSRILKDAECREKLTAAVEELYQDTVSPETVAEKVQTLAGTAKAYVYELPDKMYARVTQDDYDALAASAAEEVTQHYGEYQDSLYEPWPFHILAPTENGDELTLSWEESWLFDTEEQAYYTVELSDSYRFTDCILEEANVSGTELRTEMLPEGQYFLRVRAAIPSGANTDACETYWTEEGETIFSTMCFYVLNDGTIAVSKFDEDA